jgi:hypothetical protein
MDMLKSSDGAAMRVIPDLFIGEANDIPSELLEFPFALLVIVKPVHVVLAIKFNDGPGLKVGKVNVTEFADRTDAPHVLLEFTDKGDLCIELEPSLLKLFFCGTVGFTGALIAISREDLSHRYPSC